MLPDLSTPYPITQAHIDAFHEDGHVCLPGVCSPEEVASYREVIVRTAMGAFALQKPMKERNTYGKAFLQTLNLRYQDEGVKQFVLARRFGQIVANLTGVDAVRIYHEQALFKEPNGGITPWHQDQYYWPLATDLAVGMWMPLVDVSMDMGPICFAGGSHKEGFLGQLKISDDSQETFNTYIREKHFPERQQPMQAGDATFHNAWTLHSAGPNITNLLREAMIVTFYPDGTRVDECSNPSRVNDAEHFLGGRKAGDVADSEMNTVVYRKES
jgi:hypothetical protein